MSGFSSVTLLLLLCVWWSQVIALGSVGRKQPPSNDFMNYAPPSQPGQDPDCRQTFDELPLAAHTESAVNTKCACSRIYEPVCGTDGRSYYNRCQFDCQTSDTASIGIKYSGNCVPF